MSLDPDHPLDESDFRIITVIWRLQARNNRNVRLYENLKETLFGVVRCLSTAIDAKDPYTCGHSERVARIAVRIGEEMGLSRGEINDLYLAGLLHDVGKIGIRDEVLFKPGPLTAAEFAHVREHPVTGERIISNVTRLAYLRPAVRGHHERFDGAGYPDGLAGEEIILPARILAVADSCDAMMSARRYRHAARAGADRGDLRRRDRHAVGPEGSFNASSPAATSFTRFASEVSASRCIWPSNAPPAAAPRSFEPRSPWRSARTLDVAEHAAVEITWSRTAKKCAHR